MSPTASQPHHRTRRFWPACLLGSLTVLAMGLLWQGLARPPAAYGQVPDSGAQRYEMIAELRTSNQKLGEIVALLKEIRDLQGAPKKDKDTKPAAPVQSP